MINEIVYRKYSSDIKSQNKLTLVKNPHNVSKNGNIEDALPDLIVIDGGKGQLRSAEGALKKIGLNISLISLAKENEQIYTLKSSTPFEPSKRNIGLHLLQALRDESHRFGLAYNVKLREIRK